MPLYIVAYDLVEPNDDEEDYAELIEELEALGAKRLQKSVWALCDMRNATEIFDGLTGYMSGTKSRLLVASIEGDFKANKLMTRLKPLRKKCP